MQGLGANKKYPISSMLLVPILSTVEKEKHCKDESIEFKNVSPL